MEPSQAQRIPSRRFYQRSARRRCRRDVIAAQKESGPQLLRIIIRQSVGRKEHKLSQTRLGTVGRQDKCKTCTQRLFVIGILCFRKRHDTPWKQHKFRNIQQRNSTPRRKFFCTQQHFRLDRAQGFFSNGNHQFGSTRKQLVLNKKGLYFKDFHNIEFPRFRQFVRQQLDRQFRKHKTLVYIFRKQFPLKQHEFKQLQQEFVIL